jgi:hypothetical protein
MGKGSDVVNGMNMLHKIGEQTNEKITTTKEIKTVP